MHVCIRMIHFQTYEYVHARQGRARPVRKLLATQTVPLATIDITHKHTPLLHPIPPLVLKAQRSFLQPHYSVPAHAVGLRMRQ